jgi:sodium-dependent dicarboxylate transporter 2/3/5
VTENFAATRNIDWKKMGFLFLGIVLFTVVYWAPAWPDTVDPMGKHFPLTREAKGAIVMQALFLIRPARDAFTDFMVPAVMFIFASIMIGLVFTKTGLTRRLAYKMLIIVGEKTSMIYLGCFVVTAALTHIMAHTAVAATIYPLLVSIYALYGEGDKKTKFGKGLFIGMAYVAGAGSIVTLLGAARGAVALGFYKDIVGQDISFFQLTWYMFPVGWIMTILLWGFFMVFFKPEKKVIPGLREKARQLNAELGPLTRNEIKAALIVGACIVTMAMRPYVSFLEPIDKTAIILISTILFFITGIMDLDDLEAIPWNIILLFAGAMSIGNCLWQTGAANWMAVNWLVMFQQAHWFVFVMSIAFFVMMMTNFIMNVAAIAISLPVALVIAPYLGVAGEVILFAALVTAGMPSPGSLRPLSFFYTAYPPVSF